MGGATKILPKPSQAALTRVEHSILNLENESEPRLPDKALVASGVAVSTLGKHNVHKLGRLLHRYETPNQVKIQIIAELEKQKESVIISSAIGSERSELEVQKEAVLALERLGANGELDRALRSLTDELQRPICDFGLEALARLNTKTTDVFDKAVAEIYGAVASLEKS